MTSRLRTLDPLSAGLALVGALALFFIGGQEPYWSDWGMQDAPDVALLMKGDVDGFLNGATPTYLGSLIVRAPLFLLAAAFGGAEDDAFFVAKGVALLILAGLAAWLMTRARLRGASWSTLVLIAFVTAGSPIALKALDYGHAEDIMAACLAIIGVLAASRGRLTLAGALVGVAFVLKQWAILAWLPAVAVAPRRPWQVLAVAVPVAAAFFSALLLRDGGGGTALSSGLQSEAFEIWRSQQWFWPLGLDNPGGSAIRPRVAPDWFVSIPRLLIVGLSLPMSALWYRHRRRGGGHRDDVLLLLAVLFFGRVVLEPWNIDYYHLPFVLTLAAWEVMRGRPPVLALIATAATYFSFNTWLEIERYGDATYVMYLAWTLPLAFVLLRQLLFPGLQVSVQGGRAGRNAQGVQPAGR
jgi:hypothetical protein